MTRPDKTKKRPHSCERPGPFPAESSFEILLQLPLYSSMERVGCQESAGAFPSENDAKYRLEWAESSLIAAEKVAAAGDWVAVIDLLGCAITALDLSIADRKRYSLEFATASGPGSLHRKRARGAADA